MSRSASSSAVAAETHEHAPATRPPPPGLRAVPTQPETLDLPGDEAATAEDAAGWAFLSAHGRVLLCLCTRPELSVRELAGQAGVSTRTVHRVLAQLEAAGYLQRVRVGQRNRYELNRDLRLRHPLTAHQGLGALLAALTGRATGDDAGEVPRAGE